MDDLQDFHTLAQPATFGQSPFVNYSQPVFGLYEPPAQTHPMNSPFQPSTARDAFNVANQSHPAFGGQFGSPSRLDPLRQGAYGGQLGSPSHIDPLRQGAYNDARLRKKELIKEQELRREKFTRGIQQDLRPKPASRIPRSISSPELQRRVKPVKPMRRSKTNPKLIKCVSEKWLPDDVIDGMMKIVKEQFNHIQGLQDSCVIEIGGDNGLQQHNGPFIQIVNTAGNHWITISNINCKPNCVNVYDSCYRKLNADTRGHIVSMATPDQQGKIHVTLPRFQQQPNKQDCGLFAIAAMISLAVGKDPSDEYYNDKVMRHHLQECMENEDCELFPRATTRVKMLRNKTYELYVCCRCRRMPSDSPETKMCVKCQSIFDR